MSLFKAAQGELIHSAGASDMLYSVDGTQLITCGTDNIVRVCGTASEGKKSKAKDIVKLDKQSGPVNGLDISNNRLISSSLDNTVALYELPTGDFLRHLVRGGESVNVAKFNPTGSKVAVGCEDNLIRVITVADITDVKILKGHTKTICSLAWDPKGAYMASMDAAGDLRIWDADDYTCVKVLAGACPAQLESSPRAITFSPNGRYLLHPSSETGDVKVLDRGTWKSIHTIKGEHTDAVHCCVFSPNATYVATLSRGNMLVVWDFAKRESIVAHKHKNKINVVAWHPTENKIAYMDHMGYLFVVDKPIPKTFPHPAIDEETKSKQDAKSKDSKLVGMFADDDDDLDDVDEVRRNPYLDEDAELDDFVIDDDGAGYAEVNLSRQRAGRGAMGGDLDILGGAGNMDYDDMLGTNVQGNFTECQDPFMSGATEPKGNRRYLAFNTIGVITSVSHSDNCTVSVEFHDKSLHRPFHFTDHYKYSMAYLGERGALFASQSSTDHPSTIFYRPFESWAGKGDWTIHLAEDEEVKAIAITSKGAVAATSLEYLRFFSFSGIQTFVSCLGKTVVTMAAWNDLLMIVYHESAAYNDKQNLGYVLYNVESHATVHEATLPITPGSKLTWLSFSPSGIPFSYDSAGTLRSLMMYNHFSWVPTLDTRTLKTKEEDKNKHYWPVGITSDDKNLVSVIVRTADKQPSFPPPLLNTVGLSIPLCEMGSVNGSYEEQVLRQKIFTNHIRGVATDKGELDEVEADLKAATGEIDKLLLRLIQHALKNEKHQRALDLATNLVMSRSVEGAIRMAMHFHVPMVAERLNIIREAKLLKEREQAEEEFETMFSGSMKNSGSSQMTSSTRPHQTKPRMQRERRSPPPRDIETPHHAQEQDDDTMSVEDGFTAAQPDAQSVDDEQELHEVPSDDVTTIATERIKSKPVSAKANNPFAKNAANDPKKSNPFSKISTSNTGNKKKKTMFETVSEMSKVVASKEDEETSSLKRGNRKRKSEPLQPGTDTTQKAAEKKPKVVRDIKAMFGVKTTASDNGREGNTEQNIDENVVSTAADETMELASENAVDV